VGRAAAVFFAGAIALAALSNSLAPRQTAAAAPAPTCGSSVGPEAAPLARAPEGLRGFHSAWYRQSGVLTLCLGQRGTVSLYLLNAGTHEWSRERAESTAYLGTWGPDPGQDQPTQLGGDGTRGGPNTGWPAFNRVAVQSAALIQPGAVARFDFAVQAPTAPGTYRLGLRPVIDGVQWMEDEGITVFVFVAGVNGVVPTPERPVIASLATPSPVVRSATPTVRTTVPAPTVAPTALQTTAPLGATPPPGAVLIPNYSKGTGYSVQCSDGSWSQSGGKRGACSHHGGVRRGR
jgi:hypothetical protein